MAQLCVATNGNATCIPLDLTVFDDPRQDEVEEMPGDSPGALEGKSGGAPVVRTRIPGGVVPDAWPRGERTPAEVEKGSERIPCEVLIRSGAGGDDEAEEILLFGEAVFRAILGRAPGRPGRA